MTQIIHGAFEGFYPDIDPGRHEVEFGFPVGEPDPTERDVYECHVFDTAVCEYVHVVAPPGNEFVDALSEWATARKARLGSYVS